MGAISLGVIPECLPATGMRAQVYREYIKNPCFLEPVCLFSYQINRNKSHTTQ